MNTKEKQWIRERLYKILVIDTMEGDGQADDISDFLAELSSYVGLDIFKDIEIN